MLIFYAVFITNFSFCCFSCVLFLKVKLLGLGLVLFFDFLVFCSFLFGLINSLQKNKLSSSSAVFFRFGYRGFFFLSHAVRLWFMVFSKLRWLFWIII